MILFHGCRLGHPWVERYRIPLVTNPYVRYAFEVALVIPTATDRHEDHGLYGATMPTEDEAKVIGSLIDYRRAYYTESWQRKMLEEMLDVDGGTVPFILIRREDRWAYRIDTWQYGPTFVDSPRPGADVPGLVAVIDKYFTGPRWKQWKVDHPELFGTVDETLEASTAGE